MQDVRYSLEQSGDFVIENYNFAPAFSSFFPGIAGVYGIPLWAFYVNRGQGIASLGVRDKDGAILEFFPANQAYNLTPLKGFRTFIKMTLDRPIVYEPFRDAGCPFSRNAARRMVINPYQLRIEEVNPELGLSIEAAYITVPEEPYAALARRLTITNISRNEISLELIDGLPQIIPYGDNAWCQKHMSRTIEAWMRVTNLEKQIPFYALKVKPQDKPELEYFDRGNFYLAYQIEDTSVDQLNVIIDPDNIFGRDADLNFPLAFAQTREFVSGEKQRAEGRIPSAFAYARVSLKPREKKEVVSIIGNVDTAESINKFSAAILKADFFTRKLTRNQEIITQLTNTVLTKSSNSAFDFYTRQTFLDNFLRGGFPYSIPTPGGPFVFYLYGRKHGDLERDYNAFNLEPAYFSQGNGAYRDINQNRRNDVFFNPDVREENIRTFLNALQPDGYNPLLVNGVLLFVKKGPGLETLLRRHIIGSAQGRKVKQFLGRGFTPGGLIAFMEREKIIVKKGIDVFLKDLLGITEKEDALVHGEGYWIDHWTYNLDLIESCLAVYPERKNTLLFGKNDFTFFDSDHRVTARAEKYVRTAGKVRQFGSVMKDAAKKALIESRPVQPYKVRTKGGRGEIYRTTLFVKLLSLAMNKLASLDPFGAGIEMEADKPGWCDSLNNLPGVFGSSISETAELKRLIIFLKEALSTGEIEGIKLPVELANFLQGMFLGLKTNVSSAAKNRDFVFWDKISALKEKYRQAVWTGFQGEEKTLPAEKLDAVLNLAEVKLSNALKKSEDKKTSVPYTYFINEVTKYSFIKEGGRKKLNPQGYPLVKAKAFRQKAVAHFLEGPMHIMKTLAPPEKKKLYSAVKKSALYDEKLKMYKINAPLDGMPKELGRQMVFTPGWLENESIWMHMEYKYLLEVLRAGLYDEFFTDMRAALPPFMLPEVYGRNILESSSFVVSGAHPEKSLHGRGFVARLSGATTEFLSIWLYMTAGGKPFRLDEQGNLILVFEPALPEWLFTSEPSQIVFLKDGRTREINIPRDSFAFVFLCKTPVIYRNPRRKNTYGPGAVKPDKIILKETGKKDTVIETGVLSADYARAVREGVYEEIEVVLS
ncbi:MAG: hypothetical protein V1662_03685 [Candidatus Omnitrophota bacterium]